MTLERRSSPTRAWKATRAIGIRVMKHLQSQAGSGLRHIWLPTPAGPGFDTRAVGIRNLGRGSRAVGRDQEDLAVDQPGAWRATRGPAGEGREADPRAVWAPHGVIAPRSRTPLVLVRGNAHDGARCQGQGVNVLISKGNASEAPDRAAGISNATPVRREGGLPLGETVGVFGEPFGAQVRVVGTEIDPPEIEVDGRSDTVPVGRVIDVTCEPLRGGEFRVRKPDRVQIANHDEIRQTD